MKFLFKRLLPLLLTAAMISGCTAIPDKSRPEEPETTETQESTETAEASEPEEKTELLPKEYAIDIQPTSIKLNAESGVFEGYARTDGEYDGSGYVILEQDKTLTHIADVPTSQHYRIVIAAYSYSGAALSLSAPEGCIGTYYIPPTEEPVFGLYTIDNIYLEAGPSIITLTMLDGYASVDYFIVEDSLPAANTCYQIPVSVAGKNTGIHTIGTMKYLSDMFGVRVLTAQNVTVGTNAEIDAVFAETGRYPAMRCGNLIYSSLFADEDDAETAEKEIELALEWGRSGGIVSFGWHWYAPMKSENGLYKNGTEFLLSEAVTDRDIALLSIEEIEGMYNSEMISEQCYRIILDIDSMAQTLKRFKDERLTVVWQPLTDGDTDLYWWGGDAESYKWLWQLMFRRFNEYHGLNNLIWVYNGSSAEFYPGDDFCDVIGQGMYLNSAASFAARFAALAHLSGTSVKPVAITGCDKLPDPNYLYRDNAMWLWTAVGSGEYTIHSDGSYSESYTSWQKLNNAYNSRVCVTKDELPDFSTYALDIETEEVQSE